MIESGQSSQTDPSSQYPRTDTSDLASNLPTKAHHPKAFKFPKRSFGKKTVVNQSFQSIWFEKWPWLHYIENDDTVLCITCAQASAHKKLQWSSNLHLAFTSKGFTNWKDAPAKFAIYEVNAIKKRSWRWSPCLLQHKMWQNLYQMFLRKKNCNNGNAF